MRLEKDKIDTITIGRFDGIHRGHKELIKRLGKNGAVVVIEKRQAVLTPRNKRCQYVDVPCKFYYFKAIKELSGKEFLSLLQKNFPNLKKIVTGYDFHFGKDRLYSSEDLKRLFDGEVEVVSEFIYDDVSVHSTFIRQMIEEGNMERANTLLGREYSVEAKVIKGQGLGHKELYPTLNLKTKEYLMPQNGVYATRVLIDKKIYDSVSFVGVRLSTDGEFSLETHVIDTDISHEVSSVELFFVERLRENKKFDSLEALKQQIKIDINTARLKLKGKENG